MSPSRTVRPWKPSACFAPCEGIIPAMESAHAIAYAMKLAPTLKRDRIIVINLSGRGDKDAGIIEEN